MQSLCILTLYMVFIFSLLMPLSYAIPTEILSADIINQTCQTCTLTASSNISYDFCYASLASIPVSHVTNLGGLGLISLELALKDATNTLLTIKSMLNKNETGLVFNSCLETCQELYSGVSEQLELCIFKFMSGEHDAVHLWVNAIVQAASICEGGFEGKGYESPLTKENYSLSQLCAMILCIIDLMYPALKLKLA